ncbi:MAG: type II secretion system protein N [Candidatus Thiodiazotropha sp. DIVDIV]
MKKGAAAILLLLIGVIAYEWLTWSDRYNLAMDVVAAEGESKQKPATTTEHQVLQLEPEAYLAIAQQTLFRSDRKGYLQQPDEKPGLRSQPALPKIRLLGIILTESEPPSAMVFVEKSKKSRILHVGDELGSWKIEEIDSEYVMLSWEDQLEKIQLRKF